MWMTEPISEVEYTFGNGYVYACEEWAEGYHQLSHQHSGTERGLIYMEISKSIKEAGERLKEDLDQRYTQWKEERDGGETI